MKPPTGIPKSMLMTTSDGSYALPSGAVAVLKLNEYAALSLSCWEFYFFVLFED